jgi:hypothetical protein
MFATLLTTITTTFNNMHKTKKHNMKKVKCVRIYKNCDNGTKIATSEAKNTYFKRIL